jgi:uridine phosphorylase
MNWFDPDDKSALVISPRAPLEEFARAHRLAGPPRVHERFLMLQTRHDLESLSDPGPLTQEPFPLLSFPGTYALHTAGRDPRVTVVDKVFGAPVAASVLEAGIAMGATRLFFFGMCGAISPSLQVGDVVIPEEIVREEGTSYHYAEPGNAEPDQRMLLDLCRFAAASGHLRVQRGRTVSTDAVHRQTVSRELLWRKQGIMGVDMEMSALLSVARHHGLPAVAMLVVSVKHRLTGDTPRPTGGGEGLDTKRRAALRVLADFAMSTHVVSA